LIEFSFPEGYLPSLLNFLEVEACIFEESKEKGKMSEKAES